MKSEDSEEWKRQASRGGTADVWRGVGDGRKWEGGVGAGRKRRVGGNQGRVGKGEEWRGREANPIPSGVAGQGSRIPSSHTPSQRPSLSERAHGQVDM